MYRISCYARLKKNFFHYKKDSVVGVAIKSVLGNCNISIKKERYDFMTESIREFTSKIISKLIN